MVLRFVNNKALKNGNLCKNERCESCFYCTDRWNNPTCEYFLMTRERRNSGIGDECDKWRGLKDK